MKTVDVVATANGWYVTRRYCGQNKGMEFFSTKPAGPGKKAAKEARAMAERARDEYIQIWVGKGE